MEKCDAFFATLREHIVPLIKKIVATGKNETLPVKTGFSIDKQKEFTKYIMDFMSIDPNHCVLCNGWPGGRYCRGTLSQVRLHAS
jgi:carboxypeptidase Taq